jgi:LmbE family N-acetylglucosaminyl deacetylase
MKLNKPTAEFYISNNDSISKALEKTTHMAIGAHPDDVEIMAYDGILKCYKKEDKSFTGVIVTNGSGSARDGIYKDYTNEEMMAVRKVEQKAAADIGEYGALALLDYPSNETKDANNTRLVQELVDLLKLTKPEFLYTHNLADKHDTHLGVVTKVIEAVRQLDKTNRPKHLYGCEVWRDLDWLNDDEKVMFDVSGNSELAEKLVNIFESQIIGGKRYDLATMGRRLSNATYSSSHTVDESDAIIYAMDLTPLIIDDNLDVMMFIKKHIDSFKSDVESKLKKVIE